MKRRLAALLAALAAILALVSAPSAAADDDPGAIGLGTAFACKMATGPVSDLIDAFGGPDLCLELGKVTEKNVKKAWDAVWDSLLGDVINAGRDVAKWIVKTLLTVALMGPSLDLAATKLFSRHATLAGMLVWLGWVIATFALIWQLGKMAVTGQLKYAGQAMVGWVQNALLTGIGLTIVALLLKLGDAFTTGIVNKTFADDGKAYERIVSVMLPKGISNPIMVLGVVAVLLLVGLVQMVLIFLRQTAIPIQCLLLPIAGAGRVGGDTTRQWAPRLITSILVVIIYKPMVAIILCAGFAQFGHAHTLSEWLRGLATLVLSILAPGPLTKLFAPLGAEVGAGLSAGGALGAASSVGSYLGGKDGSGKGGGGTDGGGSLPSAVDRAQQLSQSMPSSYQGGAGESSGGDDSAAAQASRNAAQVPGQTGAAGGGGESGTGTGTGTGTGQGADAGADSGTAQQTGQGGASGAAAGLSIQVLDGINDTAQGASDQMGSGGSER
ncbi:hypothetical protein [Streptomyces sp. NPDC048636]|uniref:hypothetical protein n=1 Tax=Streptomyces sp. NPDC048636 TaxID=3155762 RepID=UPI00344247C6